MILNNYWRYLKAISNTEVANFNTGDKTVDVGIKDTSGNSQVVMLNSQYPTVNPALINNLDFRRLLNITFGSGDTDPTLEDYALETPINGFGNYPVSMHTSYEDGFKTTIIATVSNTTGSPITVREIGIEKTIYYSPSNKDLTYKCLIARIVLSTPVTIESGNSYTFSFDWVEG